MKRRTLVNYIKQRRVSRKNVLLKFMSKREWKKLEKSAKRPPPEERLYIR